MVSVIATSSSLTVMKRNRPVSPVEHSQETTESQYKAKKLKLHASYTADSPFPTFVRPTATEAWEVYRLLAQEHPGHAAPRRQPLSGSVATGNILGNVPNVIESLISVILSQNTSGSNSGAAKASLDAKFGRNNFSAMARAPSQEVADAIRQGGLANKKAAVIQKILKEVMEKHGEYTLQHLAATDDQKRMTDDAIMEELMSYDGVGPKTASCVLLFCLGRDSFAVDTHVYRLSKVLGWVPDKANRVLAQAHLDRRVPDEIKYGLHVLMVQHGRVCKGCKKAGSGEMCVLKVYVGRR